jgi:hypothetical protein
MQDCTNTTGIISLPQTNFMQLCVPADLHTVESLPVRPHFKGTGVKNLRVRQLTDSSADFAPHSFCTLKSVQAAMLHLQKVSEHIRHYPSTQLKISADR